MDANNVCLNGTCPGMIDGDCPFNGDNKVEEQYGDLFMTIDPTVINLQCVNRLWHATCSGITVEGRTAKKALKRLCRELSIDV